MDRTTNTTHQEQHGHVGAPWATQKTIKSSIACRGFGVHSGKPAEITLHPSSPNTGIVFNRLDLGQDKGTINARWDSVYDTRMGTSISNKHGATVATVEHLMAALSGEGVDNLVIDIDGPEIPIMDGSSNPFVFLLECAGIVSQKTPRELIEILEPVEVEDGGRIAKLLPNPKGFSVHFEIDFNESIIAHQALEVNLEPGVFKREVSRARTFGFLRDYDKLKAANLAHGSSLENTVVIAEDAILNQDGLRYKDEFVRHKILDCVGDLFLAGHRILGRYVGQRAGHYMNHQVLKKLFDTPDAWRYTRVPAALSNV